MGKYELYNEQYLHNERFVSYLNTNPEFADWEIIGIFYAALHYMNMYLNIRFQTCIEDINSHTKRYDYINKHCNDDITKTYKTLYDMSREARYQCTNVTGKVQYVRNKYNHLKNACEQSMLLSKSK